MMTMERAAEIAAKLRDADERMAALDLFRYFDDVFMMTMERAAEIVSKLRLIDCDAAIDLFCHFDDVFQLNDKQYRNDDGKAITEFAAMCGYAIAGNVEIL
jgi:hypothetical protein